MMIYLNNAATSFPKPRVVLERMGENLASLPENPYRENTRRPDEISDCRQLCATLFNFPHPERIALCSSATEAMNLVLRALAPQNSHVITTTTEHNAVLRVLYHLRSVYKIRITFIDGDSIGRVNPQEFSRQIRPDTRLIVVNHLSNVTGASQEVKEIYQIAETHGIPMVIDAAQSAGVLPIDLAGMENAALVFTGHKALSGPRGTGGVAIGSRLDLAPWKFGGIGIHSETEDMPKIWPLQFEAGTPNHPGIVGLAAGVDFVLERGVETLSLMRSSLIQRFWDSVSHLSGVTFFAAPPQENLAGIISFTLSGMSPGDIGFILDRSFDIRVRTGLHCAPLIHRRMDTYPAGTVRISVSPFNTNEEIDALIDAIFRILEMN
jgi:cysteine desulfurase/selenocysteine lyase